MAKVSLRIYNRDIESLIDQGQLDEAIAHCRHILNTFPKYLETYRLLGKAYLEAKRYAEATDIFQRLLMAVPDDFVAHVGMSIVNDEQNKMDDAIWHMERAFEVQPSNSAIQAELQRLYGRRDGVEPPKIRLTRGALAHMYVQGELYTQAVSEIKKVLEEDPNRQGMQVLLAWAYFHAGQRTESAEICEHLLRRYPYCLDANRVLVELLPETDRGESIQVYRQRVSELDPYAAFVRESIFHTEDAPDAAVSLERLDWNGQPVAMDVDWVSSMGVGLGSVTDEGDQQPAWLRSGLAEASPSDTFPVEERPATASNADADIPEFLREAGWDQATGASQDEAEAPEPSPSPDLAKGNLPDWVRAMEPTELDSGLTEASPAEKTSAMPGEEFPDWLREIKQDELSKPAQPFEQTDLRDLLSPEKIQKDDAALADADETSFDLQSESQTFSLQPDDEAEVALPTLDAAGLDSLGAEVNLPGEAPGETAEPSPPAEELGSGNLPDFLKQVSQPASEPGPVIDAPESSIPGISATDQDDALAWLEGLAAKHGAKSEELLTKPEERLENEPEWVRQAKSLGAEAELPGETPEEIAEPLAEEPMSDDLPDFLKQVSQPASESGPAFKTDDTGEPGASPTEQDDTSAWLEGLRATPEESVTELEERLESEPDGVKQAEVSDVSKTVEEAPAAMDEMDTWLQSLDAGSPQEQPDQLAEVLERLEIASPAEDESEPGAPKDTGAGAKWEPDESSSPALTSEETPPPDWLRSLEGETVAPPDDGNKIDDLPEWLAGLDEEKTPEPASASDSFPDWLRAESETEPASLEPVSPTDWTPAEISAPEPPVVSPTPGDDKTALPPSHEPPTISHTDTTGTLSATRDPTLSQAQSELSRGNIPGAIEIYSKLIKKGRLLDEVIFDLRETLYRYPVEVIIWQSLGDAYLRASRLQDALDAYTKAEELLR